MGVTSKNVYLPNIELIEPTEPRNYYIIVVCENRTRIELNAIRHHW